MDEPHEPGLNCLHYTCYECIIEEGETYKLHRYNFVHTLLLYLGKYVLLAELLFTYKINI